MVVANRGACADDYVEMAKEVGYYEHARLLLVSMGNDLLKDDVDPHTIAMKLQEAGSCYHSVKYVYGGSARLWGYQSHTYDLQVAAACKLVGGINGEEQLFGIETADRIGHIRAMYVGVLCYAFMNWVSGARGGPMRSKL